MAAWASTSGVPGIRYLSTAPVSAAPARALPKARRLIANAKHFSLGCSHAPLPAIRRRSSTRTAEEPPPWATSRTSSDREPCFRHPMHVRTGPWPCSSSSATTCPTCLTLLAPDGPLSCNAAEARQSARIPDVSPVPSSLAPRPRTPETRYAASAARNRRPEPPVGALVDFRRSGVGDDIDPPTRQLCCEPGVLPLLADRQRKLVIGHHYAGRAGCLVGNSDGIHSRRRQ